ncbi:MAG TPA: glycoside hydrolase family 16 protein [Kiritimatiellia bacterium]|nr:glycoside hydrolase family 16 protein [Kiritimatiellia bacterium]
MKSVFMWVLAAIVFPWAAQQKAFAQEGYRLVWADEFTADGRLDPKDWTYERGFVRNNELQWYQPDNAVCSNGCLIIEGRRERKQNPGYKSGDTYWGNRRAFAEYTSASVTTKGLHAWQYGRFEVKARIKTRKGLWPAIWFLGLTGRWPDCGEIDLMEYYKGNILANACWGSTVPGKAKWDESKKPVAAFNDPAWDQNFHVWRMDWDEKRIVLAMDGLTLNTIDLAETINPEGRQPQNPFRQPFYLLLNLAIGGNSGGDPSETPFPTRYEIDYVRVYQNKQAE